MGAPDDFKSLFETAGKTRLSQARPPKMGAPVTGTVVQIGEDSVFIDIGGLVEARVNKEELLDRAGNLKVKIGDTLRGVVTRSSAEGPEVSTTFGKGVTDVSQLEAARDSQVAVTGKVSKAVKAGVEVELGGVRAFCPASQLDLHRVSDLEALVGQEFEFQVLELKNEGRSVIVSRRALLEREREQAQAEALSQLEVGAEVTGVVNATNAHGAIIQLDNSLVAFAHVSELSRQRVQSALDVVHVGDQVKARVLSIERTDRGLNIRVSLKEQGGGIEAPTEAPDEVFNATVTKNLSGGVLVETRLGEGFLPLRELDLPKGGDPRRAFPVGRVLDVVLVRRDPQRGLLFSARGVASVQESKNFREFSAALGAPAARANVGTFGALLRAKLHLPEPVLDAPSTSGETARSNQPGDDARSNLPGDESRPSQAEGSKPSLGMGAGDKVSTRSSVDRRDEAAHPSSRVQNANDPKADFAQSLKGRGVIRRKH